MRCYRLLMLCPLSGLVSCDVSDTGDRENDRGIEFSLFYFELRKVVGRERWCQLWNICSCSWLGGGECPPVRLSLWRSISLKEGLIVRIRELNKSVLIELRLPKPHQRCGIFLSDRKH